jgi:hypothetical protein
MLVVYLVLAELFFSFFFGGAAGGGKHPASDFLKG